MSAPERVPRLLTLLPWLVANPGVSVADAAEHFGVTQAQLLSDVELLTMTGVGKYGGDLVDVDISEGITVTDPQTLGRPLRLGADEATSLLVGLRLLEQVPGVPDRAALVSAIEKLATATSGSAAVRVEVAEVDPEVGDTVEAALAQHRALHLRYLGATSDEVTERDVDPIRLLVLEGRTYLEAWCRRAGAVRSFRLDRVLGAAVLDEAAAPPAGLTGVPVTDGRLAPEGPRATLVLGPGGRWVVEQVPLESVTELPDGQLEVVLAVTDERWLVRLALALGGDGRIVAPAELAEAARAAAHEALAGYGP